MTSNEMSLIASIAVDMQKNEVDEVLDKIRAEIEHIPTQIWEENKMTYILASYYKKQVLEIIDKYRKEQE